LFLYHLDTNQTQGDSNKRATQKCQTCGQIKPWLYEAQSGTFNSLGSVIGNPHPPVQNRVDSGWLTQGMNALYPGHPHSFGDDCCSCAAVNTSVAASIQNDVSCWNKSDSPQEGLCSNFQTNDPKKLRTGSGNIFYAPLEGRSNAITNTHTFGLSETFTMGVNTELGTAYAILPDLIDQILYPF
jgi:hypothetical protein